MQRVGQRQGFLVSAVIHLTFLMILLAQPPSTRDQEDLDLSELERRDVVFLPPSEVLRQLVPTPPQPTAPAPQPHVTPSPRPVPTPPQPPATPEPKKDRVSIGPPSNLRAKGPLILRRDEDITKVAKGRPDPSSAQPTSRPRPAPTPPGKPGPAVAEGVDAFEERPGREGLRLPPGLFGNQASGEEGLRGRPGREEQRDAPGVPYDSPPGTSLDRSIDRAVDELTRRRARTADLGLPDGTGQDIYGLRFDPRGADFTLWVNDFKNQVYRNWIVPQAAYLGYGGHVDFEFTVERDGSISALRMLKSSGTDSLDRAARNSLTSSRFAPLPDDYGPPRITMQVAFHYGPDRNS